MKFSNDQKKVVSIALMLALILAFVSLWRRSSFTYQERPLAQKQADYARYLASLKVDPVASKDLYQQIITKEEVQKQVEQELGVSQPVAALNVPDSKLKAAKQSNAESVTSYFKTYSIVTGDLEQVAGAGSELFFPSGDQNKVRQLQDAGEKTMQEYYAMDVPREALEFHKAQIAGLAAYNDLVLVGKSYMENPSTRPWQQVYKDYAVINEQTSKASAEYDKLDKKYAVTAALGQYAQAHSFFAPSARAIIPVVDVKALAQMIYQEALSSAFSQFMSWFLERLIAQIESNYKIANFLYYTDALVSGQYVDDYLNKYVQGTLDKAMIKNFIPQFSCGNSQDLKQVFKAKADEYLGFDPESVKPSDPDYYTKMSKVGNFLASPSGWDLYYQGVAEQAQAAAEKNADRELTSNGLKTSRDESGMIASAITSVTASLQSAIQGYLDLGNSNSKSIAGKIVGGLVQKFMDKFLFKGAVLKEQKVCIAAPVIRPVIPGAEAIVPSDPSQPSEFDLERNYLLRAP